MIGVDDEGAILGLEHDYTGLDGNKDEFEIHLRNLVNRSYGMGFAATHLNVTFPLVNDKEICRVEIKRASEPQYLTLTNKDGVKSETFYVRSGNSSVPLPLNEVSAYIQGRFS